MKKIFIFMLVLTALCLIVSCGEASDTTVAVTGDTTAEPHTAVTTTETVITTREPLTTPSATTTVVTVKTPETTEDDGMYRAGFEMTDKLMVVVTYVAYEIPREVSVLAEKIPITLYFGVPAASLNLDVFPKDTKFVFALKTEAQETLCTIGELTLDELKADIKAKIGESKGGIPILQLSALAPKPPSGPAKSALMRSIAQAKVTGPCPRCPTPSPLRRT